MNREILFRGKTKFNNEWVEGNLIRYRNEDTRITEVDCGDWDILESGYEVFDETVCEYINRIDKAKTKLFEGDIVKFNFIGETGRNSKLIGKIEYNDYSNGFCINVKSKNYDEWDKYVIEKNGNVFDDEIDYKTMTIKSKGDSNE